MPAEVSKLRFSAEEDYRIAAAGVLRGDDRVELIEGESIRMDPIGGRGETFTVASAGGITVGADADAG